jgi:indolepyruvate ferredoxin oxidoreductase alpha subunit
MGAENTRVSMEEVVRGCGVKDVHVVHPFNVKKTMAAVQASMEYDGISVVISEELCPLFARAVGRGKRSRPFYVNLNKCRDHRSCINRLACPAMYLEEGHVAINRNLCIGCTVCAQICPENAILPLKE